MSLKRQRRDKMEKEYAEYMYQRLSADTAIRLIRSFPLRAVDRDVLIDGLVGHQGRRGWQKVYAYEIGVDVKTVSRRYQSALKVSAKFLTAYVAGLLERPEK